MLWTGWNLARIITLLVGLAYILIFIQVGMFHYRQNFRNFLMWFPVVGAPVIGLIALLLALGNVSALLNIYRIFLWIGVLQGIIGFYFHFRGIGQRVDGYVLRNFLVGPPIILPLLFSALGVVGIFSINWR